jgi:NADH-quinone oxidoreductase subunit N
VLASVVGAYYYLRIIKLMYFDEPVPSFQPMSPELRVVLGLSGAFVLFYVIFAGPIGDAAQTAAQAFF